MEDTGRSSYLGIRITALERAALEKKAGARSLSSVGRELLIEGGLGELVAFYFADDESEKTDEASILKESA